MEQTKTKTVNHVKSPQNKQVALPRVVMPYGGVLTSAEKLMVAGYEGTELADDQVVVAVSENSWLKVGDLVRLDFTTFRFTRKPGKNDVGEKVELVIPYDDIGGRRYLSIKEGQVKYKLLP